MSPTGAIEKSKPRRGHGTHGLIWRCVVGAAVGVAMLLAGLSIYLWRHWPYSGREVIPQLAETFSSTVQVTSYERFYFPHPGFVAHNIILRKHGSTNIAPLATMDQVTAIGSYTDLVFAPHHLSSLRIDGLHVQVPPPNAPENGNKFLSGGSSPNSTIVDQVTANNSILDVSTKQSSPPLHFVIHALTLRNVSSSHPITFQATFTNSLPKSEVATDGQVGPLKRSDYANTPVSGKFSVADADLGQFHGIGGKLQARGTFRGTLSNAQVDGGTNIPDFRVGKGKPEPVGADFNAVVNGMNGNVDLKSIRATADRSPILASATIDQKKGWRVNFSATKGRVQDLMTMFIHGGSPVTGTVNLHGAAFVPPQHDEFLKSLQVQGNFELHDLRFTSLQTQQTINAFSQRASGNAPKPKEAASAPAAPSVSAELKAPRVELRNGVAQLQLLDFSLPGADATGAGSFNLVNSEINLKATLQMEADLSHVTTGVKALLLKPLDPFFKKKHQGTVAPVKLTGTYERPRVGLRLPGDKAPQAK